MTKNRRLFLFIILLFSSINIFSQTDVIDLTGRVDFGYREPAEPRLIDIVVVHSTYHVSADSFSIDGVLSQFRRYGVAAHYIIGRDGSVYRAVDERNVAFHAGKSQLPADARRTNLNTNSIGIEIINTPHTPPTEEQYAALADLLRELKQKYPVAHLVRHSDIAPDRKTDPWKFDWEGFLRRLEE